MSRRGFLTTVGGTSAAVLASRWAEGQDAPKIRLSACDWSLDANGPGGLEIAQRVGLEGLEVSTGGPADILDIAKPEVRQQYKDNVAKTGVVVSSLAMGFLNSSPLAKAELGVQWLEQAVEAAADLNAKVILVAFFGLGDLRSPLVKKLKTDAVDAVVEKLKAAAPKAEKAGVILGIENTLSGKDNMAILDRVQSDAVRIYYDIRNSTDNDYDVPAELREFGKYICQVHFKDGNNYLGEGDVAMQPVADALKAIDYQGWIVLETSIPSKDRDADFKRNADYTRKLLGLA
jgi:sugar phosphate isomerase/epimerase